MADKDLENTGFLDDVVAYYPPLKSGFISIPIADSAKYGWEKPFTVPPGVAVSKENKEDAKTKVLFQWRANKQEWTVKRGLNLSYGNIEFIQKYDTSGNELKSPLIVTFDGPLNRHVLGDDNYYVSGSGAAYPVPNPLTKSVYMKGKVILDLPNYVIGVCARQSPNGKKWLVIATKYSPTVIEFFRYQIGNKDSLESIGTVTEEANGVASVVHFSDSGTQAVAYLRVIDSVSTSFFGSSYPESFEVFCARRVMIQISYSQDTPTSISFTSSKTHTIAASDVTNSTTGCGVSNNTRVRTVSFSQEFAGEFQGEILKTASITMSFSLTTGQHNSKSLFYSRGLYRDIYTSYGLDTSGPGSVGDACLCEGVPAGIINGCGGPILARRALCTMVRYFQVTRQTMVDFVTYAVNLTINGVTVDSGTYALSGTNYVTFFFDCGETEDSPTPPPGTSTVIATIGPDPNAFIPNVCVNWKIVTKYENYPGPCDSWDPLPPPLPSDYSVQVSPNNYLPVNVVMLDMKRNNYLIRKCNDPVAETGFLKGQIDGNSVNVACHHRGSALDDRFANDVGYGYDFYVPIGGRTGGVFDSRYAWEYVAQYPDDPLQIRLGYSVDGYGHVFCCASEPYDATTGISLYPVYTYLSQGNALNLNGYIGDGARFKKIGVI